MKKHLFKLPVLKRRSSLADYIPQRSESRLRRRYTGNRSDRETEKALDREEHEFRKSQRDERIKSISNKNAVHNRGELQRRVKLQQAKIDQLSKKYQHSKITHHQELINQKADFEDQLRRAHHNNSLQKKDTVKQIGQLKKQFKNKINSINKEYDNKAKKIINRIKELSASNKKALKEASAKLNKQKSAYQDKIKKDNKSYHSKVNHQRTHYKSQLSGQKNYYLSKLGDQKDFYQGQIDKNIHGCKSKIKHQTDVCQAKVESVRHELGHSDKQLQLAKEQLSLQLQKNSKLKSKVNDVKPDMHRLAYLIRKRAYWYKMTHQYQKQYMHQENLYKSWEAKFAAHVHKYEKISQAANKAVHNVREQRVNLNKQAEQIRRKQHSYDQKSYKLSKYQGNPNLKPYKRSVKFHQRECNRLNEMITHYNQQLRVFETDKAKVNKIYRGKHLGKKIRIYKSQASKYCQNYKAKAKARNEECKSALIHYLKYLYEIRFLLAKY